jgi:hypothetical protein
MFMHLSLTPVLTCGVVVMIFNLNGMLTSGEPVAVDDRLAVKTHPQSGIDVSAPPAELKVSSFYSKYLSAGGYPIVASKNVSDFALREAAFLVNMMLADLPEWVWLGDSKDDNREEPGISAKDFWDARARGMGGSETDPYCSCGEENLLGFAGDPYSTECILIHEFAHNIHLRGLVNLDPTFDPRLKAAYEKAMAAGLWKGMYASVNHHEYFAEGVQSWFDNNRENDHDHNAINTREELIEYDQELAALCREVFRDTQIRYTKPATRLTGHLSGYDPSMSSTFVWPEQLSRAQEAIHLRARARSQRSDRL